MTRANRILQALKKPENMAIVKLKTEDNKFEISKAVLVTTSDVFHAALEDSKDNEIELKFSTKTVRPIIDWMHTSSPFNCKGMSIIDIFDILRFTHQYNIGDLTEEILQYFRNTFIHTMGPSTLQDILINYKYDDIGKIIYDEAVGEVYWMRATLYEDRCTCIDKNCHLKPCPKSEEIRLQYHQLMKILPHQVHLDIIDYEVQKSKQR